MADITQVFLITGFLGSGKTTFLNRMIEALPRDFKTFIMLNEFGEIGVDGALVEGEDLHILEISKGSIFCACVKTDFIKGLHEIANIIRPDLLIIEATGAANPSALKRDLGLPIFNNRFKLAEQICLVDARNFPEQYEIFTSVELQIASSSVFVVNKTDQVDAQGLQKVRDLIGKHHSSPRIYETRYAGLDMGELLGEVAAQAPAEAGAEPEEIQDLDLRIKELLAEPREDLAPPDNLVSAVYRWQGQSLTELEAALETMPQHIVRAKGLVRADGKIRLFSLTMGSWEIETPEHEQPAEEVLNRLVFIASPSVMAAIDKWAQGQSGIVCQHAAPASAAAPAAAVPILF